MNSGSSTKTGSIFRARPIAAAYELLTSQDLWREQIRILLEHGRGDAAARRVLDLGCGPGESAFVVARLLPDAEVVGIDFSAAMIERARARHRRRHPELAGLRFEIADATALPFADDSFDLALGHSFLYLMPDQPATLREARRVLRPGGRLLLMEPAAEGSLARAAVAHAGRLPRLLRRPLTGLRFLASMALWRLVSSRAGQLSATRVRELFRGAGFERIAVDPGVGGLGLHCVGVVAKNPDEIPG